MGQVDRPVFFFQRFDLDQAAGFQVIQRGLELFDGQVQALGLEHFYAGDGRACQFLLHVAGQGNDLG